VAKKIFADNAIPKELVIPKQDPRCDTDNKDKKPDKKDTKKPDKKEKGKDNKKKTEEDKKKLVAEERNEEEEDEEEEDMKAEETKTTVTATTAASGSDRKEEGSTTTASSSSSGEKNSAEEGSIPPEKRCRGTCVTGFFSLLCDEIDRSAVCPASGRCCITRAPPPPKGEERPRPPPPQQQAAAPRPTRPPPPPPAKNSNNRVVQCPGVCIPNVMLGLCAHPSKIVPGTNSCAEGSFCCDHGAQGAGLDRKDVPPPQALPPPPPQRPPPQRQPQRPAGPDLTQLLLSVAPTLIGAASGSQSTADTVSSLMPLLAPMLTGMLSGGGGGGSSRPSSPQRVATSPPQRPPPPTRPTPPPTTTPATTTTTEKPDDREDCPGTCIAPYLSFTCFGNAETTDLFKCAKKRTTCCSPKSAVRELREQLQRANFPPLLGEAGPPGSPQFLLPPSRRNQTVGGGGGFRRPPPPPAAPAATPSFYEPEDAFNDNYYDVSESSEGAAASFPFPVSSGGGALAERPPLQYPVTNKYVCGVKGTYRSGRVVGGEDGVPGEWCWQVIHCK
jgi:hypothetical protein